MNSRTLVRTRSSLLNKDLATINWVPEARRIFSPADAPQGISRPRISMNRSSGGGGVAWVLARELNRFYGVAGRHVTGRPADCRSVDVSDLIEGRMVRTGVWMIGSRSVARGVRAGPVSSRVGSTEGFGHVYPSPIDARAGEGSSRRGRRRAGRRVGPVGAGSSRWPWPFIWSPALLVVLLVGGIGMLVLAVARAITWIARGPAVGPGSPVEPGHHPHDPGRLRGLGPTRGPDGGATRAGRPTARRLGFLGRAAAASGAFAAASGAGADAAACPGPPASTVRSICRTSSASRARRGPRRSRSGWRRGVRSGP